MKEIIHKQVIEIYEKVSRHYGFSKFYDSTPYIELDDSPYVDGDDPDLIAEYSMIENSIIIYWKNIHSKELLIRSIVHEYQHYLQHPGWYSRYYKMGYGYDDHPYEIAAYNVEESDWRKFI